MTSYSIYSIEIVFKSYLNCHKTTPWTSTRLKPLNQQSLTIALLATFMGICKVKDDNIVQAMQQAQANKIDYWNFYQARNIREEVAKSTLLQIRLAASSQPASEQANYQKAIAQYELLALEQGQKKIEVKAQAEQAQRDYDAANFRDDQFDLADALLAIAISLLAVTALTHLWLPRSIRRSLTPSL